MRWVWCMTRMGENRHAYMLLVGKPEGKRSLGRFRSRWENHIKIPVTETGWESVDWYKWQAVVNLWIP